MKTKWLLPGLFSAAVAAGLFSCGECSRKVDCPGYKDDTLDGWFPYSNGQRLVFSAGTNLFDTFTLQHIETTEPYQASSGPFGPPLRCMAKKVFQSAETDTSKNARVSIELSTTDNGRAVYANIGNRSFSVYGLAENGMGQVSAGSRNLVSTHFPSLAIGNRIFPDVIEAIGDTAANKTEGIYKLYYAKGQGLIEFSEYSSLTTWTKQ